MDNQVYPVFAQTRKDHVNYLIGIFSSKEEADHAIAKCKNQLSKEEQKAIYWLTGMNNSINEINVKVFEVLKDDLRRSKEE